MRRVLMLATYFPRPKNKTLGNWALSQAQALARQGLDIEVVSLNPFVPKPFARGGAAAYAECPETEDWNGLRVHYPRALWYPVPPLKNYEFTAPQLPMALAWRTARTFLYSFTSRFQPDVIYAHHTAVNGDLARRLSERFGTPYLITDHDFEEISACARLPKRRAHFDPIVRSSSRMIAVARRMEAGMKSLFPAARTATVWNGTDAIPAAIARTPRPAHLTGKTVLFSCGAFYRRKGFPLLIEAFARVAPRFPNAVLRIAGDGEERDAVRAAIRKHQLENQVELLGFQPHTTVLQEMVWSDAFVLIGWNEPFATVFSEALSAGKPVVSASDGGITDVVLHGVHGLLVEPQNINSAAAAIEQLLANPLLREELGRSARELFEITLKWDHNAARMKALFEDALASPVAAPPRMAAAR